jgi:AmmeMemoRadiSam system protein B
VDRLAGAVGEESAFDEELHHVREHSIELAAVWLHYVLDGKPKPVLPILCGHYGDGPNGEDWGAAGLRDALKVLAEAAAAAGVLVVAAGDLSHVGPAFGDLRGFSDEQKARVRSSDGRWLDAACHGDSGTLLEYILREGDATRICGAAPILLMLAALPGARGRLVDYDQCPADQDFGSLVSIAGALFTR